jgi:hypothetical protein
VKSTLEGLEEEAELTYEEFSAAIKKNMRLENMLKGDFIIFYTIHVIHTHTHIERERAPHM